MSPMQPLLSPRIKLITQSPEMSAVTAVVILAPKANANTGAAKLAKATLV